MRRTGRRRRFLQGLCGVGAAGVAGCFGESSDGSSDDENGEREDEDEASTPEDTTRRTTTAREETTTAERTTTERERPYGDGQIRFLLSPTLPREQMLDRYVPVGQRLNDYVDAVDTVDLQYARNYAAALESLDAGNADLAEVGPYAAALGIETGQAEVLLQRYGYGSWTYRSVVVTRENSDVSGLSDLEGRDVVFADPLSLSGSLYPLAMLQRAGLSIPDQPGSPSGADFDPTWTSHATARETLLTGQADAAGLGYFIVVNRRSGDREYVEGVEELAIREGIPRAPIVVAPGLSAEEKAALARAFTEAPDEVYYGADGERDTADDLWYTDVRPAGADTYQPVVDVADRLGYGIEVFER